MSEPIQTRLLREAVQARKMAAEGFESGAALAQIFEDAISAIQAAEDLAARWKKAAFDFAEYQDRRQMLELARVEGS